MQRQLFSKRERAAIAGATIAFVGISAAMHFAIGGLVQAYLPHWAAPAPDQTPTHIIIERYPAPRPTPTPVVPTPTPSPATHVVRAERSPAPHRSTITPAHPARTSPMPGTAVLPPPQPLATMTIDATPEPTMAASTPPVQTGAQPATQATFKRKVVPDYPQVCANENAAGRVIIDVTIDTRGSLAAAWVGQTSGFACLDEAALDAAKESTYNPKEVDGRPVAETYLILYEFSIDS